MFRCPYCGQAQEIELDVSVSVINANEEKNGHGLHATYIAMQGSAPETWTELDRTAVQEFHDLLLQFYSLNLIPCLKCEESSSIEDWLKTWKDPLYSAHLESENLCHCGGELWMDQVPGTNQYAFICEECEWVKPNQKVSGAQ